jgi:hypothetical protein
MVVPVDAGLRVPATVTLTVCSPGASSARLVDECVVLASARVRVEGLRRPSVDLGGGVAVVGRLGAVEGDAGAGEPERVDAPGGRGVVIVTEVAPGAGRGFPRARVFEGAQGAPRSESLAVRIGGAVTTARSIEIVVPVDAGLRVPDTVTLIT